MESKEARIVRLILEDLQKRHGFDHFWDLIEEDIQEKLKLKLQIIVKGELE